MKLLNLLDAVSSKLLAIVNLVNGLYSRAVILNFLNGNANLSIISSSILIFIILLDFRDTKFQTHLFLKDLS